MRTHILIAAAAAPLIVVQLSGCSRAVAEAQEAKPAPVQRAVELTIYPDDFTLVHERRPVQLQIGTQKVQLTDVSKQLDPRSVMLDWANAPDLPAPTSNSYDLGVNNGTELMKRYLGQQVELVRYDSNGGESNREKGTLMVSNDGQTVIKTGDKFLINPPGTIVAPTQSDIVTIPQLAVQVDSPRAASVDLNVSYLTRGLSWGADYVAELLPSDDAISLQCWATITNKTGATFPNAKVTLMAGQPNRAARKARNLAYGTSDVMATESQLGYVASPTFVAGHVRYSDDESIPALQERVGDLQAYSVAKPSDIVQDQMNRLVLMSSKRVPIKREYRASMPSLSSYGWTDYYYSSNRENPRGVVTMAFSFKNSEKDGLGDALPAGALRIYGSDKSGAKRYLGASDVWNAPKDAKVDVTLANAFDLYTMRKVAASKKINKRTVRKTIEIVVHNAKPAAADVVVVQGFNGKWKIADENVKHVNADASTVKWTVRVPAASEQTLKFSVDLS